MHSYIVACIALWEEWVYSKAINGGKVMGALKTAEKRLSSVFKDMPALSESSKEGLANAWPWLALVGGILQLLVAWGLWQLVSRVDRVTDAYNSLALYYTGASMGLSSADKMIIYLGILILLVDAVILLMAFPHLQKRARRGWDLLFLGTLINVAYAVTQLFTYGRGVGSFIFSLLGSAIGFYLLFQVRETFGGKPVQATAKK